MMEVELTKALLTACPRIYADVAPSGTITPYVTWHVVGGESHYYLDNTPTDKRNPYLQVTVWDKSRLGAAQTIRQVEAALSSATAFIATPEGEPLSTYEVDTKLFGSIQRFDVWAPR